MRSEMDAEVLSDFESDTNSLFSGFFNELDENNNVPEERKNCRRVNSRSVKQTKLQSNFNSLPIKRSSLALFPRQNSGMNVILDAAEESEQCGERPDPLYAGHIRNSYDMAPSPSRMAASQQPTVMTHPARPKLTSILYAQMRALESGNGSTQSVSVDGNSSPHILNRAFFGSVNEVVQKMITGTQGPPSDAGPIIEEVNVQVSDRFSECPYSQKNTTDYPVISEVISETALKTSRSSRCTNHQRKPDVSSTNETEKEKCQINLTLQFNGTKLTGIRSTDCTKCVFRETVKPSSQKSDCSFHIDSEVSETPGIVSRVGLKIPNRSTHRLTSMREPTEEPSKDDGDTVSLNETVASVESLDKVKIENTETDEADKVDTDIDTDTKEHRLGLISSALSLAGESVSTLFQIVTNIVPAEGRPPTEEEIEDKKDALVVYLMSLIGVSKETRTSVYQEACDELETFKDVSFGTVDTLASLFKWIIGKHEAKEELKYKTKAFCSMSAEVDMNSDVWKRFNKSVETSVDPVELDALAKLEKLSEMNKLGNTNSSPQMSESTESDRSIAETLLKILNRENGDMFSYAYTRTQEEPMSARSLSCIPEEDEVTSSCGKCAAALSKTDSRDVFIREIVGLHHLDDDSHGDNLKTHLETKNSATSVEELLFEAQVTDIEEAYFAPTKKSTDGKAMEKNLFLLKRKFSNYIAQD